MDKKIDALKKFLTITVAAFEIQYTISVAFGYIGGKSYMHLLYLKAKKEIEKNKPNIKIIEKYLAMIKTAY